MHATVDRTTRVHVVAELRRQRTCRCVNVPARLLLPHIVQTALRGLHSRWLHAFLGSLLPLLQRLLLLRLRMRIVVRLLLGRCSRLLGGRQPCLVLPIRLWRVLLPLLPLLMHVGPYWWVWVHHLRLLLLVDLPLRAIRVPLMKCMLCCRCLRMNVWRRRRHLRRTLPSSWLLRGGVRRLL